MKNEWKRSLSRILIAAMLLCTMQGNVVSAATELNEPGETGLADSVLKDDELTETIPGDSLVDLNRVFDEEDVLTINVGRYPGCVTKIVSGNGVDLAKFIGILQNPFPYTANDDGENPSVTKLTSENIQEYYLKWGAEQDAKSNYCDIKVDFYNRNNNNQFSYSNEASYV